MSEQPFRVVIVGCGNIADRYAADLLTYPGVALAGFTDLDAARAEKLCGQVGRGKVYAGLDEVLADPAVDGVVNLSIHHAHYAVTRAALVAGKHVFSEKPLAMTAGEAAELVSLAESRGVRLAGAPMTFLGEAQQTALKLLRDGRIGTVRVAYAEMNHGRIESWHPNPAPFYDVGPVFDVAVYPLTVLTAALGPVGRVTAAGRALLPERVTKSGEPFRVGHVDWMVTTLEFVGGPVARVTANFYVEGKNTKQQGVEFHGDAGSLHLGSAASFDAEVRVGPVKGEMEAVPLLGAGDGSSGGGGIRWGRGVAELADAIATGRPHRVTGRQAAHVVEVIEASHRSVREGRAVEVASRFEPPAAMPWAG